MAWWVFQHVVTTAIVALIVVAICRVTRIGPVARHALWVIVLIKFVTPPLVAWPWTIPDPLGLSATEARPIGDRGDGRDGADAGSRVDDSLVDAAASNAVAEPAAAAGAAGAASLPETPDDTALFWLLGLWVAGSVVLAAIEGIRMIRLELGTRAGEPAGRALRDRVAAHASRMGLEPVPIVLVADGHAPSVWGLARPRILWPAALAGHVSEIGADGLIVHELAHVKRRDHLVGWIELAGGILWWWNPLFWFVRSALREQAELACDAWVISALPNGRRAYAESLLALSGDASSRGVRSSMAMVGISATTRPALERRLVMIMKGRASLRLTFAGISSLIVAAAATLPTWAASPQVTQPPASTPSAPPAVAALSAVTPPVLTAPASQPPSTPPVIRSMTRHPPAAQLPSPPPRPAMAGGRGRGQVAPDLPEAARSLQEAFSNDQQAILAEMMQKTAARRDVFMADMQRLQDELAKAGNLDDAIAIRNYLRMAAPATDRPPTGRGGRGRIGGGGR